MSLSFFKGLQSGYFDKIEKKIVFWLSNENKFWADQNKKQICWNKFKIHGMIVSGMDVWLDEQVIIL